MTIIDIAQKLLEKRSQENAAWIANGLDIIRQLSDKDADDVVNAVLGILLLECEIGLGISDYDLDEELKFFDAIDKVYQQAAGNCYFCNKETDPNAKQFTRETRLCTDCQLKLANIMQFLGIQPAKLFPWMLDERKIQKERR